MTVAPARPVRSIAVVSLLVAVAACGTTSSSGSPGASGTGATSPAASPAGLSASPLSTAPSVGPSAAIASTGAACVVTPQSGLLPSDHLVDLAISTTPTLDLATFVFAPQGAPSPAGAPRGTLDAATPPFSFAGSGQVFELLGEHAVQVRFTGMAVADESGQATYRGPRDVKPALSALREIVQYDASEGIVAFDIGYDGPGCITLSRDGDGVALAIAHR